MDSWYETWHASCTRVHVCAVGSRKNALSYNALLADCITTQGLVSCLVAWHCTACGLCAVMQINATEEVQIEKSKCPGLLEMNFWKLVGMCCSLSSWSSINPGLWPLFSLFYLPHYDCRYVGAIYLLFILFVCGVDSDRWISQPWGQPSLHKKHAQLPAES